MSVSYTHLDVYKRQGISKAEIMNACGKSRGTIFTRFKQISKDHLIKVKRCV